MISATAAAFALLVCAPAFRLIRPASTGAGYVLPQSPGVRSGFQRDGARYVMRGNDYQLSLSASETVLRYFAGFGDVDHWFREEEFRLQLVDASSSVNQPESQAGPGKVAFSQVYPGIDLECGGTPQRLEYRFLAGPGADSGSIRIRLQGASSIRVEGDGAVSARTPLGSVRIYPPLAVLGRFLVRRSGLVEFRPRAN